MRAEDIIAAIKRQQPGRADQPIGVRGSQSKRVEVDQAGDNRDLTVYANTDDIDLDSEVVVPEGADPASYFFRNRSVFVDHCYEVRAYVGKLRSHALVGKGDGGKAWKVRMRILPTPFGDDILTIAREAGIGTSIGFRAMDYGPPTEGEAKRYGRKGTPPRSVVRKWEWLEQSLTAMPCNVACQSTANAPMTEARSVNLDRLVTGGLIRRESAWLMGLPDREPEPRKVKRILCPGGLVRVAAT